MVAEFAEPHTLTSVWDYDTKVKVTVQDTAHKETGILLSFDSMLSAQKFVNYVNDNFIGKEVEVVLPDERDFIPWIKKATNSFSEEGTLFVGVNPIPESLFIPVEIYVDGERINENFK